MQQAAVHIDEHLLAERLIAGDPGARDLVYDRYAAPLYSIILQVVTDGNKAQDVLAAVFVHVFVHAEEYRQGGNVTLFGWMMRIARETALKIIGGAPAENGLMIHNDGLLQRFTATLPEPMQQVFRLCYYKGLSREAIGRMMGLQPTAVSDLLNNAMRTFRKFLKE